MAYGLALAAIAPFCGYIQDLFGRRNETLFGGILLIVGCIVLATANTFASGIVAMCLAGGGAAICELTALAGVSELVPVKKRGFYLAIVTFSIIPFCPYLMYSELLGTYHTWRVSIWICMGWNAVSWIGILVFYWPTSQTRAHGKPLGEIVKKIDFLGAFLSITGLVLFLVAMQAGGYSHSWSSAYVLCQLLIGILLIAGFVIWEWKFAPYPMVPHEMFAGQTIVGTAYGIAFVAGMNFFALLNFFPILFKDVFEHDPVQIGLKGIPPALTTTFGAVFTNAALSWFKGWNRELLLMATVIMTTFTGALACVTPDIPKTAVALGSVAGFGVGGVSFGPPGLPAQQANRPTGARPSCDYCHYSNSRHHNRHLRRSVAFHSCHRWCHWLRHLVSSLVLLRNYRSANHFCQLQRLRQSSHPTPAHLHHRARCCRWSSIDLRRGLRRCLPRCARRLDPGPRCHS